VASSKAFCSFSTGLVNFDLARRLNRKRTVKDAGLVIRAVQGNGMVQKDRSMMENKEKLLIDIRELSELTGIAVGSLYHMVSQRRIPCVRLSQRCLRFSLPAIREWLASLSEPAVKDASKVPKNN
jgi:predicted DNA-binding transcriptional regulator AlpA